jgi:outer membrane protein OmpA-like peptidoglycan-associated protein
MQSAKRIETQSYGVNLGLRFFLGNKKTIITIASIDQNAPTICGTCTGSVTLHGLEAGKSAIVSYTMNGAATPTTYTGVVAQDGTIKIPGLCAGTYTGINATIGKNTSKNAITTVGLVDPQLTLTREVSSNITVQGTCDGSITLYGLTAGQHAVVTYSLNGTPQTAYETTVAPDNTILVSGLCEGTYTAIMVTSNKCTATLNVPSTVVLTAPVPAPPPPPVVTPPAVEQTLKLAPVMFDFDKSVIHKSAYPRLDQLAKDLLGNSNSHVNIEGNTDAIGTAEYNQKLSERRAAAVKRYLMDKGVSASQIRTEGDGKRDPVADNKTKEGRRENRNAELQEIKK